MTRIVTRLLNDPPRVEMVVTGLPSGTDTVTVRRLVGSDDPSSRFHVLGLQKTGNRATGVDWECPVGWTFAYLAEARNATGLVLEQATSNPISTPEPPNSGVWFSDPLDPTSAVCVPCLVGTDSERRYNRDISAVLPAGQTWPRVSIAQVRYLPEITVCPEIDGPEQAARFRALIAGCSALALRFPRSQQLPAVLYGQPNATEVLTTRWNADRLGAAWRIDVTLTEGPALPPNVSDWTYQKLAGLATSYRALPGEYGPSPVYRDTERRP